MNCPSCGTDEFYEGFLSRECKKLGCKLYTEKHAEACRKADVEMDNEGPAKQTQAPDWAYTTLGLPVPNRLGGISWNHPNNTVQPKGNGGGIPYMLNTPRLYEQRTGVVTIDDGAGGYEDVTPATVTATHVKAAQMIDTNHPSKDSARLCQLMIAWLGAKAPTKLQAGKPGQVRVTDSTQPGGWRWADPPSPDISSSPAATIDLVSEMADQGIITLDQARRFFAKP